MQLGRTVIPVLILTLAACTPTVAEPAGSTSETVGGSIIEEISLLLDAKSTESDRICGLLRDQLESIAASSNLDRSGQTGFMGTPITCRRTYAVNGRDLSVTVYTAPQFVSRIANGPPPGVSFEPVTVQTRQAFLTPDQVGGMPAALIINAAPEAVIFIPASGDDGRDSALTLAQELDLDRLTPAETIGDENAKSVQRSQILARNLKQELISLLPDLFVDPDISLDPVGTTPRCLDIGQLHFERDDFLYLSFLVGKDCLAQLPRPNYAASKIATFETLFEQSEQAFDGSFSTRGLIVLSSHAALNFQAIGDQQAAERVLSQLPLLSLSDEL